MKPAIEIAKLLRECDEHDNIQEINGNSILENIIIKNTKKLILISMKDLNNPDSYRINDLEIRAIEITKYLYFVNNVFYISFVFKSDMLERFISGEFQEIILLKRYENVYFDFVLK